MGEPESIHVEIRLNQRGMKIFAYSMAPDTYEEFSAWNPGPVTTLIHGTWEEGLQQVCESTLEERKQTRARGTERAKGPLSRKRKSSGLM
jgi:hypothetical protein